MARDSTIRIVVIGAIPTEDVDRKHRLQTFKIGRSAGVRLPLLPCVIFPRAVPRPFLALYERGPELLESFCAPVEMDSGSSRLS